MRMPLAWQEAHPMRVAVVTKIFPSSLEPLSAPFNRQQLAELARSCDVDVLAAIPHLPFASALSLPTRAARLSKLPERETIHGLAVTYVRQLYVPRVGLPVAVPLYLASLLPHRERLRAADVVLATWAYPDGCAAVLAARALGKPCVVKVHGSDVNVVLRRRGPSRIAARVLPEADALVAVSQPLARELVRLGCAPERVHVVKNGVDEATFFPRDRARTRRALGVEPRARVVLFVGRLEPRKGLRELLAAFDGVRARLPEAKLVLIGDGVMRAESAAWALRSPPGAVTVLGPLPQTKVAEWMGACDVLSLPSWAEGMPNVVWEALASGRPVVASSVGGVPDVLGDGRAGILVPPRDARALAEALFAALRQSWDDGVVRECGPPSWQSSAEELLAVLVGAHARRVARSAPVEIRGRERALARGIRP
jgi:glycosyltransferase involved in cell wall biosynthesis